MKEIKLTQNRVALVDDADFEWLSKWKWFAAKSRNTWYARRNAYSAEDYAMGRSSQRAVFMHQLICPGCQPDHKDGNGLNNQRHNLRPATKRQNAQNRKTRNDSLSGVKGAWWYSKKNRWVVRLVQASGRRYVGSFKTLDEAARAYDAAAKKEFGEFARLNFPESTNTNNKN